MLVCLQRLDERFLLLGRYTGKHRVFLRNRGDVLKRNTREGDVFVGIYDAALLRDHADGQGVITRDDLDGNTVFTEEFERIRRGLADVILDRDEGDQHTVEGDGDDAVAFLGAFGDIAKAFILLRQEIFGSAHEQLSAVAVDDTGILVSAGEGDLLTDIGGFVGAEILKDRFTRCVPLIGRAHQHADVLFGAVIKLFQLADGHGAVGEGTGLIQTDHVDAGEVLERVQLLYQCFLFRQSRDGYHQRDRGGQHQTRRDHTDAEHTVRQYNQRPRDGILER